MALAIGTFGCASDQPDTPVATPAAEAGAGAETATGTAANTGVEDDERLTGEQTVRFLDAFEQRDIDAVANLMSDETTLVQPYSFTGAPEPAVEFAGKEQVLNYFRQAFTIMGQISFDDRRVSVVAGGGTSFVQANGNFTTASGGPYRNVYLFRFDWQDGLIVSGEEYANPVTFATTFNLPLG
nr:nuclear transport factor 2 family protein [Micromonospora sp. DSM 115978]